MDIFCILTLLSLRLAPLTSCLCFSVRHSNLRLRDSNTSSRNAPNRSLQTPSPPALPALTAQPATMFVSNTTRVPYSSTSNNAHTASSNPVLRHLQHHSPHGVDANRHSTQTESIVNRQSSIVNRQSSIVNRQLNQSNPKSRTLLRTSTTRRRRRRRTTTNERTNERSCEVVEISLPGGRSYFECLIQGLCSESFW